MDDIVLLQGGYDNILSASRDHPWVWGNFLITSILGGALDAFTHPVSRKLSCKPPAVKDRYNELVDAEFKRLDIDIKLDDLQSQGQAEFNEDGQVLEETISIYNNLNTTVEAAIKYADRNCKTARTRKVPFSPTMKKLQGATFMWSEILKYCLQKKCCNLCLLRRLGKKWVFNANWHKLSTTVIQKNLKDTRLHYRQYKP